MFCKNCGSQIKEDAKFCPSCGQRRVVKTESAIGETDNVSSDTDARPDEVQNQADVDTDVISTEPSVDEALQQDNVNTNSNLEEDKDVAVTSVDAVVEAEDTVVETEGTVVEVEDTAVEAGEKVVETVVEPVTEQTETKDVQPSASLNENTSVHQPASQQANTSSIQPKKAKKSKTLIVVFIIIGLAVVAAVAYVLMTTSNPIKNALFPTEETTTTTQQTTAATTAATTAETTAATSQDTTQATTEWTAQAPAAPQPGAYVPYGGTPNPTTNLESMVLQGATRYYSDAELSQCSQYELGILRNGLYAISGKRFTKNKDVIRFFESCSWYRPDTTNDSTVKGRWNNYQRANLESIVKYER